MSRILALVIAIVAIVAASCASEAPDKAELSEALVRSGLDEEVADCTASALIDSLEPGELEDLVLRGPGAAPVDDPDRTDDSADRLREAMDACRVLQAERQPTTTTTTTTVPVPPLSTPDVPATDGAELVPVEPGA